MIPAVFRIPAPLDGSTETRRRSLQTLGAAALAAVLPRTTEAANKKKKKLKKKCAQQKALCRTIIEQVCDDSDCVLALLPCCEFCFVGQAVQCVSANSPD